MKIKNLTKKIRLLEARQKKDAKKLAKLKRKLSAATTAGASKTKKKSAGGAGKAAQSSKSSTRTQKKERPGAAKPKGKVKKKLNLSPERRAQLAAAMKARWAAKRAAAGEANPQNTSTDGDFTLGQVPQSP